MILTRLLCHDQLNVDNYTVKHSTLALSWSPSVLLDWFEWTNDPQFANYLARLLFFYRYHMLCFVWISFVVLQLIAQLTSRNGYLLSYLTWCIYIFFACSGSYWWKRWWQYIHEIGEQLSSRSCLNWKGESHSFKKYTVNASTAIAWSRKLPHPILRCYIFKTCITKHTITEQQWMLPRCSPNCTR